LPRIYLLSIYFLRCITYFISPKEYCSDGERTAKLGSLAKQSIEGGKVSVKSDEPRWANEGVVAATCPGKHNLQHEQAEQYVRGMRIPVLRSFSDHSSLCFVVSVGRLEHPLGQAVIELEEKIDDLYQKVHRFFTNLVKYDTTRYEYKMGLSVFPDLEPFMAKKITSRVGRLNHIGSATLLVGGDVVAFPSGNATTGNREVMENINLILQQHIRPVSVLEAMRAQPVLAL
jgi:hypothetical protein